VNYSVFLHRKANKELSKTPPETRNRIIESIKTLKNNPKARGKKLKPLDFYRIRVGDYRVIYEVLEPEKKAIILAVGHRSKIYDDFKKIM